MAYDLFQVIAKWQDIGIYGVALPFLLIFIISFALLEKINLFGSTLSNKKNIHVVIALILGLLFLQNIYLVERIQFILPKVGFSLLIFVLLLLLVGVFTGSDTIASGKWKFLAFAVAIIFLAWSISPFDTFENALDPILYFFDSLPQELVLLAIGGGIIYLLVNADTKKTKTEEDKKPLGHT